MQKLFYTLLILMACSCTSYPEAIENVLRQAGDNRGELEKVFKHYSRDPADSLKLRAAEFLIVNMPGRYSVEYHTSWENIATVYRRLDKILNKQFVMNLFEFNDYTVKDDVTNITAIYLINNIDLAFQVWEQQPWGKSVSFNIFCEEILPYRIGTEPLENWRERVLACFDDLDQYFGGHPGLTAVEACSMVNLQLSRQWLFPATSLPPMSYTALMASSIGSCDEMSTLATFTMRALGIPVTQDYTPLWPNRTVGHTWNSVYDSTGRHISFMGSESNPGVAHFGQAAVKSKVYRHTFAKQVHIKAELKNIPPILQYPNIIDVTSEYGKTVDINIPILNQPAVETGYAYLAVPYEASWTPVGWGVTDQHHIKFSSVSKKLLYMPVYYHQHIQTSANFPFWLEDDGSCRFFQPDSTQKQYIKLTEILPSDNSYIERMLNGRFEGANNSDFSDAKLLYTIKKIQGAFFHSVDIHHMSNYRYIRYFSSEDGYCSVAELEFYDHKGNKLNGTIIGTPGAWGNSTMTCDKVFDGDVATRFDAENASNAWVGLDLGEPAAISKIRFLPRTDGNSVYEGHTYELFYWDGQQWHSLGKQIATGHQLYYQTSSNTLFFLRNVTTKKSGQYFTVQDGVQKWLEVQKWL